MAWVDRHEEHGYNGVRKKGLAVPSLVEIMKMYESSVPGHH